MEDAAEEGSAARDRAAQNRASASSQLAGIREPLRERHADAGPKCSREPCVEGRERAMGRERDGEDGRERRQRPVHEATEARLDALEEKRLAGETGAPVQSQAAHMWLERVHCARTSCREARSRWA